MGDRANVHVIEERGGDIYLYTHWGGTELPATLARALDRGRSRWDDESYLTRIIFSEMVANGDDLMGETGYGISTYPCDQNYPHLVVRMADQTVEDRNGSVVPFEAFVEYYGAAR